jgi:hypothetical protein
MYRASRRILALSGVALLSAALADCDIAVNGDGGFNFDIASAKAQDTWARSYPLDRTGRIEIINVNGRITAEATDGKTVEVLAERTAKAASEEGAKELLKELEMREEVGDERVRIEVRAPRMNGPKGHEIKWTVKVPRGVAVDLRTVNGGVRMNGLEGEVRARSTNGGITGTAMTATAVDASTTNGGVEFELVRPVTSGTFELQAVNGGVSLTMPDESKADVAARCVNGGISLEGLDVKVSGDSMANPNDVERLVKGAKKFRRRLDGQLNGGGARVSLETVNGGVKILRATERSGTGNQGAGKD